MMRWPWFVCLFVRYVTADDAEVIVETEYGVYRDPELLAWDADQRPRCYPCSRVAPPDFALEMVA